MVIDAADPGASGLVQITQLEILAFINIVTPPEADRKTVSSRGR